MKISWNPKFILGIKIIDKQHADFVLALNEFTESIENLYKIRESIGTIFSKLDYYAQYHFKTEEKYFAKFKYEGAEEHITEHRNFSKIISSLKKQYQKDEILTTFNLARFLEDWLFEHLSGMDKKYVSCFKDHGLK